MANGAAQLQIRGIDILPMNFTRWDARAPKIRDAIVRSEFFPLKANFVLSGAT
jgi:hypothetical protein